MILVIVSGVHLQNMVFSIHFSSAAASFCWPGRICTWWNGSRLVGSWSFTADGPTGESCWLMLLVDAWDTDACSESSFFLSLFSFVFERIICSNPHVGQQLEGSCIDGKVTKERCPKLTLLAQEPEDQKEYLEVPRVADGFQKQKANHILSLGLWTTIPLGIITTTTWKNPLQRQQPQLSNVLA